MNNCIGDIHMSIKQVVIFCSGVIIGGFSTYFITKNKIKKKYADLADEEINSVKDFYNTKIAEFNGNASDVKNSETPVEDETPKINDIIQKERYIPETGELRLNLGTDTAIKYPNYPTTIEYPYLIEPDDFGDMDGYSVVSMSYYNNGILVEDMTQVPADIEETIGAESLKHFGDPSYGYEEGIMYVRNEHFRTDFEITKVADDFQG